jgi:hypothetical protein
MMTFFIILQFILLLFMLFHDWLPVPPLNNIAALKASNSNTHRLLGSLINGLSVLIPFILTLKYYSQGKIPPSTVFTIFIFYLCLTIGTILSWWVPYIFGSSDGHKQRFSKFKNTHHFLLARGDNIVPNTLHVILHFFVWLCLAISIYFLIKQ